MTKDDIIKSKIGIIPFLDKIVDTHLGEGIHKSMDEYAKQQVIALNNWIKEDPREFTQSESRPNHWYPSADGIPLKYYSLEELYDLFDSEQQNKGK